MNYNQFSLTVILDTAKEPKAIVFSVHCIEAYVEREFMYISIFVSQKVLDCTDVDNI